MGARQVMEATATGHQALGDKNKQKIATCCVLCTSGASLQLQAQQHGFGKMVSSNMASESKQVQ